MVPRLQLTLLTILIHVCIATAAYTNAQDLTGLLALKDAWENEPPSWTGTDPCGDKWEGIACNNSHVISITLSSTGLSGTLPKDIYLLTELQTLDLSSNGGLNGSLPDSIGNLTKITTIILSGCSFNSKIPDSIGYLRLLVFLSLNSNRFIGEIPATIGLLSNLYWLDLADNLLTGSIPVSNGLEPGLDLLHKTKHFHFGNNQLSGDIPQQLFSSDMSLNHVLFQGNKLTGRIPPTLGLVQSLDIVRLDNNALIGPVPTNINNLTQVTVLFLSNNKLTGSLPDLTSMLALNYLDMSNNTFFPSEVPSWLLNLTYLTTLMMEGTRIQGALPVSLFGLPQLQNVVLRNNDINGTLDIGSSFSKQLQVVDLRSNNITAFTQRGANYGNPIIILAGNLLCNEDGSPPYCSISQPPSPAYSTPLRNCVLTGQCSQNQVSSPSCKCANPYHCTLHFIAPSFSNLGNTTYYDILQKSLVASFQLKNLPVDTVSLSNPHKNKDSYLEIQLDVFPSSGERFDRTGVYAIAFLFTNQTFEAGPLFGPYFFTGDSYDAYFADGAGSSNSSGVIIGAAAGGVALVILLVLAGIYACRQKKRAEVATQKNNPFGSPSYLYSASWDVEKHSGAVPQLKGARSYSFEELKKCTNNFSDTNDVGSGGYGKVYRGTLPDGQLIAIKRAQQGSMQGAREFKTEIELLSRVHHKNVVSLLGFCFEKEEQMLVYEYIPNGTLRSSLTGKSGIRLDWMRRLKIALGTAKGIQYLHDLADPPIIHRDIKSTNILLDDHLTAKVADFGLSKLVGENDSAHVTTQVKGTMGYLDPEYYMTQQLTDKSDVYSFGISLLELVTARAPIEKGKFIVREMKQTMDKTKVMYNLQGFLDRNLGLSMPAKSLERFVDVALRCVEEAGANRPSMAEVVKEIERIMELAGLNPNAESATTLENYNERSKEYPYGKEDLFAYSGAYAPPSLEPK